ncbi:MAG: AMP-dependent synthetase/ligase [bacterium]
MTEPKPIPHLFLDTVQRLGDRTALRKKQYGIWHDISWNDYHQSVTKIASALLEMGLDKEDRVAIIGDNCPEWVMVDMAVLCAGGVSVGIYATSSDDQCEYVLTHSESKFLFVENEEQLDKWLQVEKAVKSLQRVIVWDVLGLRHFSHPKVMTLERLLESGAETAQAQPELLQERLAGIRLEDLAFLIYTSGTTGPPKGAMLSHGNLSWMSHTITQPNPVSVDDEVMSFLPLCHIFERIFSVLAHVNVGYVVNFIENLDTVTDNMREISPTVGYGVPRAWEKYYSSIMLRMADASWFKRQVFSAATRIGKAYSGRKMSKQNVPLWLATAYLLANLVVFRKLRQHLGFDRLRIAYSGAAPISPDVLRFFQSIGINLVEGYGQTEGTGVTTATEAGNVKLGTVGQVLPGAEIKIAEDGEILLRSPGVFRGYFKDPQATAAALHDGWLRTGDIGEIDQDGFLRIIDRKKDILITAGGKNIAPQYIENKLKFSPYINDAVVIGDRRKYLTALIIIDEENVMKFARDHKLHFSTYEDLTKVKQINDLIQKDVDKVNKTVARVEEVRCFVILPKMLYEEDGEVTPTMKVKRRYINEQYRDLIASMYEDGNQA